MFAVIETGGKQYKITRNSILNVEFLGNPKDVVYIEKVCMLSDDNHQITISPSDLSTIKVKAEVLDTFYAPKIIVFKKRRRKNYRRKHGHKQLMSKIQVMDIIC